MNAHRPWCIAHRGARDEAPENTCSAFERALTYPIDGIELDVQMSLDKETIIYHDPTLYRLIGRRFRVADQTRAQLAALDWGRWFHKAFAGEPLNTLEQTLTLFGPRTRLLIEIKVSRHDQKSGRAEQLTRKVVQLLAQMPRQIPNEHILVLSFDPDALKLAHQLAPHWRYVLNLPERNPEQIMAWPKKELGHLWAIDGRIDRLTQPLVDWAKTGDLRVFTYTCNTPRQVQKALGLGLDAILSDRPKWLTQYLSSAV